MALGKSNILAHLDWNNAFDLAAFVVQVDYEPDGSYDLVARNEITRAAEAGGFKNVDSSMSRAAFDFVPGSWERFQQIVKAAARESGITLTRVGNSVKITKTTILCSDDLKTVTWCGIYSAQGFPI